MQIPFDPANWRADVPRPHSEDPTQWLFSGHPRGAENPLQVAVARLLGYRWPRQTGSNFMDCPVLGPDGLEKHVDDDGVVPLMPIHGEPPASERVQSLLADAFGLDWSPTTLANLLAAEGFAERTLEDWLRDAFFEQHCALFHHRPFVWHLWDGRPDGFNLLVNYHRLAAPGGEGAKLLDKITHTYLGDWIARQRADQKADVEGADARLGAAEYLRRELERIREGEAPYDIFIRWKPLAMQPVGWTPDLDDGVRLNIRPFMTARPLGAKSKNACILRVPPKIKWDKDRGKEPQRPKEEFPWFWKWDEKTQDFAGGSEFDGVRWNDLHYSRAAKTRARR